MNHEIDPHAPAPEFRAHLEWQIESALRREARFAEPVPSAGFRRLRTAVVVVAALVVGGAVGIASGEVQDARQRDALLASAQSEEQLLRVRAELAKAELQEARRRVEIGAAGREQLAAAEQQVKAMERALQRVRLDMEEIKASSAAPRNELQAPLVKGRDFVRDRLELELANAEQALRLSEQAMAEAERRVLSGVAQQTARLQAEMDMMLARERMQQLHGTLTLREKALRGEIKPDEVAAEQRVMELSLKLELAQQQLKIARTRVQETRRAVEVGVMAPIDLKRAEIEALELELQITQVRQELERLTAKRRE